MGRATDSVIPTEGDISRDGLKGNAFDSAAQVEPHLTATRSANMPYHLIDSDEDRFP
jgi:hypothetical protein